MDPKQYVGRAPEQVENFIKNEVKPAISNFELGNGKAELTVWSLSIQVRSIPIGIPQNILWDSTFTILFEMNWFAATSSHHTLDHQEKILFILDGPERKAESSY